LTTDGILEPETYNALTELPRAGIDFIVVTGRPAGWGQALASITPARAVITENGGVIFVRAGDHLQKIYGVPEHDLPEIRRSMHAAAAEAINAVPDTRYSSDSAYREVDLALDWNEECSVSRDDAERAAAIIRAADFTAVRSNVHVNFGPKQFNKFSACELLVRHLYPRVALDEFVYVGDALNDGPVFGGFPRSVGVANVRQLWDELSHRPKFVTESAEGAGVRELVEHLLGLASAAG
jgi:HAD superfamily hydrolase (TIGR01484 family)